MLKTYGNRDLVMSALPTQDEKYIKKFQKIEEKLKKISKNLLKISNNWGKVKKFNRSGEIIFYGWRAMKVPDFVFFDG